jgi:hypothetical protein
MSEMAANCTLGIVSDIHYAGAAEQARGNDYEFQGITNPPLRWLLRMHRHFIWMRQPLCQNHLLDRFLETAPAFDYVVANGDYSCNSAFIGVSDDAACQSAQECLQKLRQRFGSALLTTFGDHELGKMSFVGRRGGMRLLSWQRATQELKLVPFWRFKIGNYVLLGVVSSLIALPVFEADALPEELQQWRHLRQTHLQQIRDAFDQLTKEQRVLLFCHDPSALPFLWAEPGVQSKLGQLEHTIIGHLHSPLILWQSKLLAGMPRIQFLGHTARRMSTALREARHWRPFKVRLCPAIAGIELLKDGGYLSLRLDPEARQAPTFTLHRLNRDHRAQVPSPPAAARTEKNL